MSSSDCFIDPEELQAFEESMTREVGWVDSQQDPTEIFEDELNPMESSDRYYGAQNPCDMEPDRNVTPAPLLSDVNTTDPFAAHDARTCSCKSLARIQASLKKTAAENGFVLTPDQLEEHATKIDADNRKTHLFHDGQTGAQRSGSMTRSSRQQRGEYPFQSADSTSSDLSGLTLPPLAPAPRNRQTAGILPAPSATNSSSGRRSGSGALPSTAPSSEQYACNHSMPGSRADQRPRG
jgi:hypothetical protein